MNASAPPLAILGSLLFTLMGPIGAIPLFVSATNGADRPLQRKIALTAYGMSLLTLALAVFVGAGAMGAAGTSPSSLIIAAGLILTLTALRNIFGSAPAPAPAAPPSVSTGFMPIAIPGMVTPMSVAVLIIFVSYFPAMNDKLAIMSVVFAIMSANLLAMLGANWFMRVIGMGPLVVLGAVFGVLQAGMGIEMIVSGLLRSKLLP